MIPHIKVEIYMKDYKLKIGSKTVYLVDPNPKETVNSFLESLRHLKKHLGFRKMSMTK